MLTFTDIDALKEAIGSRRSALGTSPWLTIDQAMIDRFAEATGDFQWIHVDIGRAKASPFGGTIAHGFFTLSLLPRLANETYRIERLGSRINYGCNRVRFTAPVPADSRIRASFRAVAIEPARRGVRLVTEAAVEREGSEKPVCIAELIAILLPPA